MINVRLNCLVCASRFAVDHSSSAVSRRKGGGRAAGGGRGGGGGVGVCCGGTVSVYVNSVVRICLLDAGQRSL